MPAILGPLPAFFHDSGVAFDQFIPQYARANAVANSASTSSNITPTTSTLNASSAATVAQNVMGSAAACWSVPQQQAMLPILQQPPLAQIPTVGAFATATAPYTKPIPNNMATVSGASAIPSRASSSKSVSSIQYHQQTSQDLKLAKLSRFIYHVFSEVIQRLTPSYKSSSSLSSVPDLAMKNPMISPPPSPPFSAHPSPDLMDSSSRLQRLQQVQDLDMSHPFLSLVHKLLRHNYISTNIILLGLKFIDRVLSNCRGIRVTKGAETRVFIIAVMLAQKITSDSPFSNKTWEKISKIPLEELNLLEKEFLGQIEYSLHLSEMEYNDWIRYVKSLASVEQHRLSQPIRRPQPQPLFQHQQQPLFAQQQQQQQHQAQLQPQPQIQIHQHQHHQHQHQQPLHPQIPYTYQNFPQIIQPNPYMVSSQPVLPIQKMLDDWMNVAYPYR